MSLANDQNCATSDMLKMPTQMKNATPTYGTRAATAAANSSMHTTKNVVTPTSSLTRSTRDANQPYIGTNPISSSACPAAVYERTAAPPPSRTSASRTGLMAEAPASGQQTVIG